LLHNNVRLKRLTLRIAFHYFLVPVWFAGESEWGLMGGDKVLFI
jgi:hypothetical protein